MPIFFQNSRKWGKIAAEILLALSWRSERNLLRLTKEKSNKRKQNSKKHFVFEFEFRMQFSERCSPRPSLFEIYRNVFQLVFQLCTLSPRSGLEMKRIGAKKDRPICFHPTFSAAIRRLKRRTNKKSISVFKISAFVICLHFLWTNFVHISILL